MSKLEAGCKAFIINDNIIPENNWKVVELLELDQSRYDPEDKEYFFYNAHDDYYTIVPTDGLYWKVEGDLLSRNLSIGAKFKDQFRFYRPEQLIPLKGDFKLEQQTTENSLSCV